MQEYRDFGWTVFQSIEKHSRRPGRGGMSQSFVRACMARLLIDQQLPPTTRPRGRLALFMSAMDTPGFRAALGRRAMGRRTHRGRRLVMVT